jgi:hypothetical protein
MLLAPHESISYPSPSGPSEGSVMRRQLSRSTTCVDANEVGMMACTPITEVREHPQISDIEVRRVCHWIILHESGGALVEP